MSGCLVFPLITRTTYDSTVDGGMSQNIDDPIDAELSVTRPRHLCTALATSSPNSLELPLDPRPRHKVFLVVHIVLFVVLGMMCEFAVNEFIQPVFFEVLRRTGEHVNVFQRCCSGDRRPKRLGVTDCRHERRLMDVEDRHFTVVGQPLHRVTRPTVRQLKQIPLVCGYGMQFSQTVFHGSLFHGYDNVHRVTC